MSSLLSGMAAAQEADVFVGVHGTPLLCLVPMHCSLLCLLPCAGASGADVHVVLTVVCAEGLELRTEGLELRA